MDSEIPTAYSLRLKQLYADQNFIVLGYTNRSYTYIPTDSIIEMGGYEADHPLTIGYTGRFVKGTEKRILGEIDRLCRQLG